MGMGIPGSKDKFCCIFQCSEKLMREPIYFSCDVEYHRVGIWWNIVAILWGKYGYLYPAKWILLHFPTLWGTNDKL